MKEKPSPCRKLEVRITYNTQLERRGFPGVRLVGGERGSRFDSKTDSITGRKPPIAVDTSRQNGTNQKPPTRSTSCSTKTL
jgi:hypothetical protein